VRGSRGWGILFSAVDVLCIILVVGFELQVFFLHVPCPTGQWEVLFLKFMPDGSSIRQAV
jgi:hypothetical protein